MAYRSWKQKFNSKFDNELGKSNSLSEISKKTKVSKKGLQKIYNKGIGAYKTNPSSVRPNVKSKEQWAMARVYSAVMGGKASKVDSKELKLKKGGNVEKPSEIISEPYYDINTYDFSGYDYQKNKQNELGVFFLLTGEYDRVAKEIYKKDYSVWLYYNYISRANISWKDCKLWFKEAQNRFSENMLVPIILNESPFAKDGRSNATWFATSNLNQADRYGFNRELYFKYKDLYYFNECNMVGNYDNKSKGWGTYFQERNTGLLIPYFEGKSYHFTTLIHEFAHCLDFQKQLKQNIIKYDNSQKKISNNIIDKTKNEDIYERKGFSNSDDGLETNNLSEDDKLQLKLYGSFNNSDSVYNQPITNHFSEFIDSLIEVLRECKNGSIKISKVIEQETIDMQIILSGLYGDLLKTQREVFDLRKKEQAKNDEFRTGKRFNWNISKNKLLSEYIIKKTKFNNVKKIFNSNSNINFKLIEVLNLDNIISNYIKFEYPNIMNYNPQKAKSQFNSLKTYKQETNRIINNHYDNIKNDYEFGFKPKSANEIQLSNNADFNDFQFYKEWKDKSLNIESNLL